MTVVRRPFLLPALIATMAVLVTGCGAGNTASGPSPQTAYAAVLDVRTPAEFAAGHVEGARNLDVQSSTFTAQIASLARTGTYLAYCHSGNRAVQAATAMTAAGLSVVNGGGIADMQSAGFRLTS